MTLNELLHWQWATYPRNHRSRANLLLHAFVVPLFWFGFIALLAGLLRISVWLALPGLAAMAVSVALQGRGHRIEEVPPEPFSSPGQAVARILLEQWITFPRYVLTGGWWRAWKGSGA